MCLFAYIFCRQRVPVSWRVERCNAAQLSPFIDATQQSGVWRDNQRVNATAWGHVYVVASGLTFLFLKQRLLWVIFLRVCDDFTTVLAKTWHFSRVHFSFPHSSGLNEKLSCKYACGSDWCWRILSTPDSRTQRTTNLNLTASELKCVEFFLFLFFVASTKLQRGCQEILHVQFLKT